ncbi:hypothetical protein D3C81_1228950 [compost metagenome]
MVRAQTQPFWLIAPMSEARRTAASRMLSSLAKVSLPMMLALRFGSREISSRPGWMYWVTCFIEAKPPQATIFSRFCGWYRRCSKTWSPPFQ